MGTVREVVPLERLVLTHAWLRDDGKPGHETTITVALAAENGATRMTFRQGTFESVKSRDEHNDGWSSAFALLAEHLLESRVRRASDARARYRNCAARTAAPGCVARTGRSQAEARPKKPDA